MFEKVCIDSIFEKTGANCTDGIRAFENKEQSVPNKEQLVPADPQAVNEHQDYDDHQDHQDQDQGDHDNQETTRKPPGDRQEQAVVDTQEHQPGDRHEIRKPPRAPRLPTCILPCTAWIQEHCPKRFPKFGWIQVQGLMERSKAFDHDESN